MTRRVAPEAILVVLPAWVAARVLVGVGWLVARLLAEGEEPHALARWAELQGIPSFALPVRLR